MSLALPVALQMLLQSVIGMTDVIMIGDLGATSVAAVGLASKIHFLLIVLMSGFATGCSVLIAQYSGAGDDAGCRRILSVTLIIGMVVITPFVLAFALGANSWVNWINPDPEVVRLTALYLVITAPVLWLTQLIVIYEASLRALGNTTMPLMGGMIAAVANVALNYALIYGNWGFPAMGVAGAAWATVIARGLQLAFIVGWIYWRRHGFALDWQGLLAGFDKVYMGRYIAFVLPLVANYTIWAVGNSVYHVVTGFAGTDALAVMGVLVPIESAFFALFIGFANASAILIGRSLGADRQDDAMRLYRFFNQLTFTLVILLSLVLWFARPWVLAIFDQLDAQATALLYDTLAVFCALVWLKVFNMMRIIGVLRAGGDNRFCLITDTVVMWLVGLPIYAVAVFFGHISFIWIYALMYLEDALKLWPVMHRIRHRKWMRNLTHSH
ncbi:MATE family efflux transporter [Cellvibrio sp. KB43]|uniref:MATE family efflux transporter n=2 Tax=Cellvibrio polysaccharolyticus TaxID=2082724 RepID=A0A928V9F2_9GAMM|nr:MATE family efflux transporter [Cellvibrio polysaccharolyticus]